MKTVWIVVGGWDYEGFDRPKGVYSTQEIADEAREKVEKNCHYDKCFVFSYEMDE